MKVHIKYYALIREELNREVEDLDLADGSTVDDLIETVGRLYPDVRPHLSCSRIASSEAYLSNGHRLVDDGCYSVIPPVSGG